MKLWLLRPVKDWEPWYDKAFGFVVRAYNEGSARQIASQEHGEEGMAVWLDPRLTTCEQLVALTAEGHPSVVIRDFAAA